MLRALWFIFLLCVLAVTAMWLADNPGQVSLVWHGYVIETSAAVMVAAVGTIGVLSALAYRLWIFIRGVPAGIARFRRDGRRRRGYLALSRGMVAVAAGDPGEARRQAGRAGDLLDEPSLTMLLSAQSAQLSGDEKAAQKFFTEMLNSPDTEFLGLRGLLNQAIKLEHSQDALKWARRASRLKPESAWAARTLFDLASRSGLWEEADEALAMAIRKKHVSAGEARRPRAVLGHLMSVDAEGAGDIARALKLSKKASQDAPGLSPVQIHFADLLKNAGKQRKAANALEAAWATTPVPELAVAYWAVTGADDAMTRMKAAQTLAGFNPKDPATALMLARAALDASLWGEARKGLKTMEISDQPLSSSYCQLMANLEEGEHQDLTLAREWLVRAASASPDPTWVCEDCGNAADSWTPLCGGCGGFDKFQWRLPVRVPGLIAPEQTEQTEQPKLMAPTTLQDVDGERSTQ
ncbi:MAG: heme biosynthesis protein HemY [Rhodospirillaceae bacterium]|nr:heme biosynthesis protein HemY [Rhodospirillaceae bacterium]MBL6942028.1 heme biosynthesis protein HemY [Rhodospirillales bacterium]